METEHVAGLLIMVSIGAFFIGAWLGHALATEEFKKILDEVLDKK